uniref:HTH_48 domain-containing protein n=1 Tax=Strongyloides venezuelensis TaxID=75913 RepID=A0A0K0F0X2_STRVS
MLRVISANIWGKLSGPSCIFKTQLVAHLKLPKHLHIYLRSQIVYRHGIEFKRGTNAAKTTQDKNETFGEDLVSHATIKRWFKKSREGSEDLENEECGRHETVLDSDELRKAVMPIHAQPLVNLQRS